MAIYLEATKKPDGNIRLIAYDADDQFILIDNIVEAETVHFAVSIMVDLYDRNTDFKVKVNEDFPGAIQSKENPKLFYIESDELFISDLCELACGGM